MENPLQNFIRFDLEALGKEKVRLSPAAQGLVATIIKKVTSPEFRNDHKSWVDAEQKIQMLVLGLKYASGEKREDFWGDGRNLMVLTIPIVHREFLKGLETVCQYEARMAPRYMSFEIYRGSVESAMRTMLSDLNVSFAGHQVQRWRANTGSIASSGFKAQRQAPSLGQIDLAFDIPQSPVT